ncbi:hypothetical protein [Lentibacillus amyloliquefaciens]|uniref:Uncharacterized protein n=1 Tax=Lentibacillus amyloliquefaciens TaxID=1472767 RepID=A0A0U4DW25_9BACI|nr:hypothetical protein [Lentibacillus amyloliquefaciens]ALX49576.1 hypothetical protein AOX59_13980 [Lentibacillus amyloliquefaciens]
MDVQFLTIEEFNELLQQWHGQSIKISKHELDDLDETLMTLQDTSYERNTRRIDDYEPMHALQLNGTGTMKTDAIDAQPLPLSVYEIPLEDNTLYEFDGQQFLLSTSRGVYKIEKE